MSSIRQKPKKRKNEPADHVLDADDLVVGGENVAAPEAELVMLVAVIVMSAVACDDAAWAGSGGGFGAGRKIVHRLLQAG